MGQLAGLPFSGNIAHHAATGEKASCAAAPFMPCPAHGEPDQAAFIHGAAAQACDILKKSSAGLGQALGHTPKAIDMGSCSARLGARLCSAGLAALAQNSKVCVATAA